MHYTELLKVDNIQRRLKCQNPWFEIQIEYNEKAGCCCYYRGERDEIYWGKSINLEEYWNGSRISNIRRIIVSNKFKGTGCEGCQSIKYGPITDFLTIPKNINKVQKENWNKAVNNFMNRKVIVDSYPVRFYINFGLLCNLKCVMCSQENLRKSDQRVLPAEFLIHLKNYMIMANEIMIIGGEPLLLTNARNFIDIITNDSDYSNVKLSIVTNGTLLNRYLEKFKSMKRIGIWVSLDSIGNAYEYIRTGAVWQETEKNILAFKELGEKNGLEWTVNIGSVIMKSSIPRLVEFVDWCIEKDTPVHFVPLSPQDFIYSEDIFNNPNLLKDVPNWEEIFNTAITKLNKNGWISSGAIPLGIMKNEIKARLLNLDGEVIFNTGNIDNALLKFLEADKLEPENINIYNNLGVSYWYLGDKGESLKYIRKALEINSNSREVILNCGRILISLKESDEALKLYRSYLINNPNDKEISDAFSSLSACDNERSLVNSLI